ncbi:MAG: tetratricopeptide repeat protein, partial [Anaerolineae bacterium]
VALAQYYFENGAYEDVIAQTDQILAAYPDNQDAQFLLGMAYVQEGQTAVAIEPLSQFVEVRRQSPMASTDTVLETALYFLGTAYLEQSQPEEAISIFKEALVINHTDADAMFQLGQAYTLTGQHDLAVEQYHNAVRFVPDFTEAYQGMMASYSAQNDTAHVAYARGMEAFSLKDYETARTHLQSATESLTDFAPAYVGLGLALEQLGDYQGAAASLEQALAIDPENFMASNALGRIQLLQEKNS